MSIGKTNYEGIKCKFCFSGHLKILPEHLQPIVTNL